MTAGYVCCLAVLGVSALAQKEAQRREFTPQMRSFLLAAAGAARSTRVTMTDSRDDKGRSRTDAGSVLLSGRT